MVTASLTAAADEPATAPATPSVLDDLERGDRPVLLTELSAQPFALCRRGKRQHRSTVFRWALRGVRGHKLETIRHPAGLVTTRRAYFRFLQRLSGQPAVPPEPPVRRSQRGPRHGRRQEQTLAVLRAAGIASGE